MSSSQILLYSGTGQSLVFTEALENQLRDLYDNRIHAVSHIKSFTELTRHSDPKSIKAIFVPGGNAFEMWNDLDSIATKIITTIDKHKISYYGVCAGGILASSLKFRVEAKLNDNGFWNNREIFLDFFPATALAPLFPPVKAQISAEDLKIVYVESFQEHENTTLNLAHIAGPGYLPKTESCNTQVLTTYSNLPSPFLLGDITFDSNMQTQFAPSQSIDSTKIAESIYHKRASGASLILTGSHPEINSTAARSELFKDVFGIDRPKQEEIANALEVHDENRNNLAKRSFEKLGISCKN